MCEVPAHTDIDWIEYHIRQLKPIFHEFEDIIMCVKTGDLPLSPDQPKRPCLTRYMTAGPGSTDEDGNGRPDNTDAWRDMNFSVDMSAFGEVPPGDYDIFLKINDPREQSANRRCIQFANHDT